MRWDLTAELQAGRLPTSFSFLVLTLQIVLQERSACVAEITPPVLLSQRAGLENDITFYACRIDALKTSEGVKEETTRPAERGGETGEMSRLCLMAV